MKRVLFISILFAISLCWTATSYSEPIAIFVNINNPIEDLTSDDVRKIYQDEMIRWPEGDKIVAYDLPLKSKHRTVFSEKVLGKSPEKVVEEWGSKKITNTAKNPPIEVKNEFIVLIKVSNDVEAIGYLPLSMIKGEKEIRILLTIGN